MEKIESKSNKIIKEIKKLKRKKYREELGLYIEEGEKQQLRKEKIKGEYIVINERVYESLSQDFLKKLEEVKSYIVSEGIFKEISTQEASQGIMLIKKKKKKEKKLGNTIVVLDKIQDPGNMGTILRTIEALGIKDIVIIKGSVDIYNPKCVRSSMGILEELNIEEKEVEEFIREYKEEKGYKLLTTGLSERSIDYRNYRVNREEKEAIIFGSEGQGVCKELKEASEVELKIPIYGRSESLNVGVSVGILLYGIL